ncbi:MAG: hypothetical protein ACI8WB_003043 [Phenylobacterium sp.]|jgi:hypothetical protein
MNDFSRLVKPFIVKLMAILMAVVFAMAYGQDVLYSSNQNTYFLHGLANGGLGLLSHDWMAGTLDPFPVFSALVSVTSQYFSPLLFYVYYAVLLAIFILSIMKINGLVWGGSHCRRQTICSFVLITFLSSALFYRISTQLVGIDVGQIFFSGVANQYILGQVFQPSTFGVFLVLSVATFLAGRAFWAIVFLAIAATFHPSYLLSAATLTLSYMVLTLINGQATVQVQAHSYPKRCWLALCLGLFALILVTPVVLYSYGTFAPTSAQTIQQAQSILVEQRIVHHAQPASWFGIGTVLRLAIMVLALWLLRKQPLFWIMSIPFVCGLLLTLLQLISDSHFLALLFPWRVSAFLLPMASCVLIGGGVSWLFARSGLNQLGSSDQGVKRIDLVLVVAMSTLMIAGIAGLMGLKQKTLTNPLTEYVRETATKGQLYLIPPKMGQFRLQTGARILVDWKTHPYKDVEVIEWYQRFNAVSDFYGASSGKKSAEQQCDLLKQLVADYQVTDVVYRRRDGVLGCSFLTEVYETEVHESEVLKGDVFSVYMVL